MDPSSVDALRHVPMFSSLDDDSLSALARHCRRRIFRANQSIFNEGDPGHSLYVIVFGRVNIQTSTSAGEVVHIATRVPGEQFGELSLIDQKPRMADAITADESILLILERDAFMRCIKASPAIALGVMSSLADRLREAAEQLESQQGLSVSGRLAEALLELAKEHGLPDPEGGTLIDIKLTQDSLAAQIGCKRETINRAISGLRATGAIRNRGRSIIITDAEKLRQFSVK
jgi:CRP/FNR family cyclic AMP-dependent transcriptional regulator